MLIGKHCVSFEDYKFNDTLGLQSCKMWNHAARIFSFKNLLQNICLVIFVFLLGEISWLNNYLENFSMYFEFKRKKYFSHRKSILKESDDYSEIMISFMGFKKLWPEKTCNFHEYNPWKFPLNYRTLNIFLYF